MKRIRFSLLFCAVAAGCLVLSGCSKSKENKPRSENNTPGTPDAVASDDSADMRMKWPVGRKFPMHMELARTVTTKVPSLPEPVKQLVNLAQDYDLSAIKDLPDGGRELDLEFKTQTMTISQGDRQVMNFDSTQNAAQDAGNPVAPLLRKMIGAHIRYLTDADGRVQKVEGTEELLTRIGFNRKSQEQAAFRQMFEEETLRMYGSIGEMVPNRTVKVGETWTTKREYPSSIGNLAVEMKSTFKSW